jgi:hypothetical protein
MSILYMDNKLTTIDFFYEYGKKFLGNVPIQPLDFFIYTTTFS